MSTVIELALLPTGITGLKFQLATETAPYTLLVTEYIATETAIPGIYTITVAVADGNYRIKSIAGQWPISLGAVKILGTSGKVYSSFEELEAANNTSSSAVSATVAIPQVLVNAGYDPTLIVVYRGTTWNFSITNLGDLSNLTKIWFTLRTQSSSTEANSIVQIEKTLGLLISNKATATTSANGSLTVVPVTGDDDTITIVVKPAETMSYPVTNTLTYDIKVLDTNGVRLIHQSDKFHILPDVTRKIS